MKNREIGVKERAIKIKPIYYFTQKQKPFLFPKTKSIPKEREKKYPNSTKTVHPKHNSQKKKKNIYQYKTPQTPQQEQELNKTHKSKKLQKNCRRTSHVAPLERLELGLWVTEAWDRIGVVERRRIDWREWKGDEEIEKERTHESIPRHDSKSESEEKEMGINEAESREKKKRSRRFFFVFVFNTNLFFSTFLFSLLWKNHWTGWWKPKGEKDFLL